MKKINPSLNSRGVSLMEVMITIVILSIISVGLMTFLDNSISAQNFVTFKAEADALTNEIRTTLGDTTACLATFNSASPASLQVDTSMSSLRTGIYSKTNTLLYATSSTYGDRALVLSTLSMGNYSDVISTEGAATLTIIYTSTKRTAGPTTIARSIPIVTQKASTSLTNCYSKAAGSDSLWMAIGTTSVTAIYFASGPVGVGSANTPNFSLDVRQGGALGVFPGINIDEQSTSNRRATLGFGLDVASGTTSPTTGWVMGQSFGDNTVKDFYLYDETADVLRMLVTATGSIGVGSTSPTAGVTISNGRLQITGENSPTSGAGVEIGNPSGVGVLLSYDRGTSAFRTMRYNGLDHRFESSSTEYMRLTGGGYLGIGTTAPTAPLTVGTSTANGLIVVGANNGTTEGGQINLTGAGTNDTWNIDLYNQTLRFFTSTANANQVIFNNYGGGGSIGMAIGLTGATQALDVNGIVRATSFLSTSDRREKENIETAPGLELIMNLRGVTFQWKKDHKPGMGVVAQEVEEYVPQLIFTAPDGKKSVFYEGLIGPLIESVKELNVMCKMSETQNQELAARVRNVEHTVAALEEEVAQHRRKLAALEIEMADLRKYIQKQKHESLSTGK